MAAMAAHRVGLRRLCAARRFLSTDAPGAPPPPPPPPPAAAAAAATLPPSSLAAPQQPRAPKATKEEIHAALTEIREKLQTIKLVPLPEGFDTNEHPAQLRAELLSDDEEGDEDEAWDYLEFPLANVPRLGSLNLTVGPHTTHMDVFLALRQYGTIEQIRFKTGNISKKAPKFTDRKFAQVSFRDDESAVMAVREISGQKLFGLDKIEARLIDQYMNSPKFDHDVLMHAVNQAHQSFIKETKENNNILKKHEYWSLPNYKLPTHFSSNQQLALYRFHKAHPNVTVRQLAYVFRCSVSKMAAAVRLGGLQEQQTSEGYVVPSHVSDLLEQVHSIRANTYMPNIKRVEQLGLTSLLAYLQMGTDEPSKQAMGAATSQVKIAAATRAPAESDATNKPTTATATTKDRKDNFGTDVEKLAQVVNPPEAVLDEDVIALLVDAKHGVQNDIELFKYPTPEVFASMGDQYEYPPPIGISEESEDLPASLKSSLMSPSDDQMRDLGVAGQRLLVEKRQSRALKRGGTIVSVDKEHSGNRFDFVFTSWSKKRGDKQIFVRHTDGSLRQLTDVQVKYQMRSRPPKGRNAADL